MNSTMATSRLSVPVDFIEHPSSVAKIERLLATIGLVEVAVDFRSGRTRIQPDGATQWLPPVRIRMRSV